MARSQMKPEPASAVPRSLRERLSSALLGVKGASLNATQEFEINPMARLKLLIVSTTILVIQKTSQLMFCVACCVPDSPHY
jgi:hypothetical protein